jgi:molybdopterin molybdotransferase
VLELEQALNRILAAVPAPGLEDVPVTEAYGRVLAGPARAHVDLPGFDNSAMDGYAVRAADTANSTPQKPTRLRLTSGVAAGQDARTRVGPGECARIFTGAMLPPGADAVVMQEDTRADAGEPAAVVLCEAVQAGENIRRRGEDVREGTVLLTAGARVNAGSLNLLVAAGVGRLSVGARPRVGLLATGSELRSPGSDLAAGQIYESNRPGLAALAQAAGALPELLPLTPDTLEATTAALRDAFARCDVVVTTGGVSVGETDYVKRAFAELGGEVEFWRVAIKPGRPFVFGRWGGKLLFGLPGNPVSALVTFVLLARPALLRWQGAADVALPAVPGVLGEPVANPGPRRHFVRVSIDAAGGVVSAGAQGSHVLSSLARANGLLEVPSETTLAAGAPVRVLRWE